MCIFSTEGATVLFYAIPLFKPNDKRVEITLTSCLLRIISTYENKVNNVNANNCYSKYFRKHLFDKYDKISFPNFADMILEEGEAKNCSNTFCNIDIHIR